MNSTQADIGKRKLNWKLIFIPILVVVVGVVLVVIKAETTPDPVFPSLVESPNTSLHGTVAYYDNPSRCIKVISASGAKSKDVMCMPEFDPKSAQTEGKPVGWNLTWRSDNRLEITSFLMSVGTSTPTFKPGWQKVVDVVTGAVEEIPAAQIAALPTPGTRTGVSPTGAKIAFSTDSGHGVVTLTEQSGAARTLLNVQGNPETYRFNSANWSPDFKWVAVDDGHVLVVNLDNPAKTWTLTPQLETDYGYDALHWFDITAADLLD